MYESTVFVFSATSAKLEGCVIASVHPAVPIYSSILNLMPKAESKGSEILKTVDSTKTIHKSLTHNIRNPPGRIPISRTK
jgi:hypothetical protein